MAELDTSGVKVVSELERPETEVPIVDLEDSGVKSVWLVVELDTSGVKVVSEDVLVVVELDPWGFKVVSEIVWLTTELVTKVWPKLTTLDEGGLFCVTLSVVSSGVVSEIVRLEVIKVGLKVNISGCKVVSELVGIMTEVIFVGLELTIVVDEGGLVCVTLMVVGSIVVSELVGLETEVAIVELGSSGFKVV